MTAKPRSRAERAFVGRIPPGLRLLGYFLSKRRPFVYPSQDTKCSADECVMGHLLGRLVLTTALLAAAACTRSTATPETWESLSVPMATLLLQPKAHDGALVQTYGFVRLEHEGTALYETREAMERADASRALWLQVGWPVPPPCPALHRRQVRIRAVFGAQAVHSRLRYPGSLSEVREVVEWPLASTSPADCNLRFRYYPPS